MTLRSKKQDPESLRASWVGNSFEIGNIAGVNVFDAEPTRSLKSSATSHLGSHDISPPTAGPSSQTADTFVTAPSHLYPTSETDVSTSQQPISSVNIPSPLIEHGEEHISHPASSTTHLLRPSPVLGPRSISQARTEIIPRSALKISSNMRTLSEGQTHKGKEPRRKAVRIQDHHPELPELSPASPRSDLERTGSGIKGTSAAAAEAMGAAMIPDVLQEPWEQGGIVLQDRMIVRVSYTKDESLGSHFDEAQNRTAQNMESREWTEFMVVWRKDRIEFYEDYSIPFKEMLFGHKHLSYQIPLNHPRTKLSLFSFVDLTFCFTCAPMSAHRGTALRLPFYRKSGTYVFVCKVKSRSRATDWVWHVWRYLGGQLPPQIEIRSPILDVSLKVDVPDHNDQAGIAIFARDNLVKLCMKSLSAVQDWEILLRKRLDEGAKLELSWRTDTSLDWVWWPNDVNGQRRDWAVLSGLALNQAGKPAHLEARIGEHVSSYLHLKDGTHLPEPPPVEGYLDQIKPATQGRRSLYLTVHDGLLFALSPTRANPPNPPGTIPPPLSADEDYYESIRAKEVRRGAIQVYEAQGVIDLRGILAVRRAFQVTPETHEPVEPSARPQWEQDTEMAASVEHEDGDEEDCGGEDGLTQRGGDRMHGRMKRCFELVMTSGRVLRFEAGFFLAMAFTAKTAIEWIERLRALVRYWQMRHFVDTRQEMDVVHYATGRPRITPHRYWHHRDKLSPPEPLADPSLVLPYLSTLYNWCAFDSCRPIAKTGRIYARRGANGQYKLVHLFLVGGHLVQFRIKSEALFHPRRSKVVNLLDAYTASGIFAAQELPRGQYKPNSAPAARRYRDGLETNDPEEDLLFVVYYYPHTVGAGMNSRAAMPSLSTKRKLLVFRARSKVERDLWCSAINMEIEKIARATKEREARMRDAGKLVEK
ncbi:hypothetical protein OF83DRAFT_1053638 [Amylostereum chailletii]|nr:hypothetical protein OF83DRAFT_1053638 [Amylostereum chailletii]